MNACSTPTLIEAGELGKRLKLSFTTLAFGLKAGLIRPDFRLGALLLFHETRLQNIAAVLKAAGLIA